MAKKKTSKKTAKKSGKKKSAKKGGKKKLSEKQKAIIAGLKARKPTLSVSEIEAQKKAAKKKAAKRRRPKSATHTLSTGSRGTTKRRRGKRFSTKVKVGRIGAKVSCPQGATLITSSVTRKKKDAKTGKVKKLTYIAGQCVMI